MEDILKDRVKTGNVYLDFNIQGRKFFEDKPLSCPICGHEKMGAVELLGVKHGPFFWECDECESRFLRYPPAKTDKLLKEAEELHYDLEELDNIHLGLPN